MELSRAEKRLKNIITFLRANARYAAHNMNQSAEIRDRDNYNKYLDQFHVAQECLSQAGIVINYSQEMTPLGFCMYVMPEIGAFSDQFGALRESAQQEVNK